MPEHKAETAVVNLIVKMKVVTEAFRCCIFIKIYGVAWSFENETHATAKFIAREYLSSNGKVESAVFFLKYVRACSRMRRTFWAVLVRLPVRENAENRLPTRKSSPENELDGKMCPEEKSCRAGRAFFQPAGDFLTSTGRVPARTVAAEVPGEIRAPTPSANKNDVS